MHNTKKIAIIILIGLFLLSASSNSIQADETLPPDIISITPAYNSTINVTTPLITIEHENGISINQFILGGWDWIDDYELTTKTATTTTHQVSGLFSFAEGRNNFTITYQDRSGTSHTYTHIINVDTTPPVAEEEKIDIVGIIRTIVIFLAIFFAIFSIYILYLKKTRNFTFQKFFIRHPIKSEVLTIYTPLAIAFLTAILFIGYAGSIPQEEANPYLYEYLLVFITFIAIAPYGISSQIARRRLNQYERAFSTFLFEISDAMRGGLDPAKAVIEISKNDTSILKKHLRRAADNIKLGRPFEEVMQALAKPIPSDLIKRYATIIGETSKIGGEPASVIHRAAKDMDDFIKVSQDRRRQLSNQVTIIYIGFIVLLIVLYQLIQMFPNLGTINTGLLTGNLDAARSGGDAGIVKMSYTIVKQRFLDLVLVNAICTGTIIGSFVDGHIKYGFIHSMVMASVGLIFFLFLVL